jgi:hypothetical protein
MDIIGEEYKTWLTTLTKEQLLKEETNLKVMADGEISRYTEIVSKFKLNLLQQVKDDRRSVGSS